jgi:hypothetical protein
MPGWDWRTTGARVQSELLMRRDALGEWRVRTWARLSATADRLTRPASRVLAFLVVLYGAATLSRGQRWPDWLWTSRFATPAYVVLGAVTTLGYLLVTWRFGTLLRRADEDQQLYSACRDIARFVIDNSSIASKTLGVHVWEVGGPRFARRLRRRATFRPVGHQPLPIVWRKGKGAIGRCWADGGTFVLDLEQRLRMAPDQAAFERLNEEERMGLKWREFEASRHYRAVYVTPLYGGAEGAPTIAGCISIDVQEDGKAGELELLTNTRHHDLAPHFDVCERVLRGA